MTTIRMLTAAETRANLDALCAVLADCVSGGASVGFMAPFGPADAAPFWQGVADAVDDGGVLLLVAEREGTIAGTVQVGIRQMPNQPHRGDLKKLLVARWARGHGLARALMDAAEAEAVAQGKSLLVLDTATGSPAERIYEAFGWSRAGVIPDYALYPDGRYCDTTVFYKRIGQGAALA